MVIIFDGTTLELMKKLQQFSGHDEKATLDFMLENFKIMKRQDKEIVHAIYNDEKAKADAAD